MSTAAPPGGHSEREMIMLGSIIGATVAGMGGPWGMLGSAVLAVALALAMGRGLIALCDAYSARRYGVDPAPALLAGTRAALAGDEGRPRLCWHCGFPCVPCHEDDPAGRDCTCPCYS